MVIYEPKGKAREYSPLACNLYKGCSHGCIYCYAPRATFNKNFTKASPRAGILVQVEKEAAKCKVNDGPILLCFTCDPYQPIDHEHKITRQALEIFSKYNLPVQILTKGGMLATRDFDILSKNPKNTFAVTLTTDDEALSKKWEPFASLQEERITSLKIAHEIGITTWVSFEPVFDPPAVFRFIEKTHSFVDLYKVGKLNYHPKQKEINWPEFRENIIETLTSLEKNYYIKRDLADAS